MKVVVPSGISGDMKEDDRGSCCAFRRHGGWQQKKCMNRMCSKDLTGFFSSLDFTFESLGEGSWQRAKICLYNLVKDELFPNLDESFNEVILIRVEEVVADGVGAKPDKKKEKKKKALRKGIVVLIHFIKDIRSVTSNIDASSLLEKLSNGFHSLLDLKDASFDLLLQKVKEFVISNESRRLPKGTRDFSEEHIVREKAFSIITNVFKRHNAMPLDNPICELRETLTGKYDEDSKLIYDLAYQIRLNHQKLMDGMLDIRGVPSQKNRTICLSIDKLDKQTFEQIKKELIDEKGLNTETVEKIGLYVKLRGHPLELFKNLKKKEACFLQVENKHVEAPAADDLALWMFTEAVEIALMFSVYLVVGNSMKGIYMVVIEILKTLRPVDENPYARYCGTRKLMKMKLPLNWTKDLEENEKEVVCSSCFTKSSDFDSSYCAISDGNDKNEGENEDLYFSMKQDHKDKNLEHFTKYWVKDQPLIIRDAIKSESKLNWDPIFIIVLYLERSAQSREEKAWKVKTCSNRFKDETGRQQIFTGGKTHANVCHEKLKFKVWLSSEIFREHFPSYYDDVMHALPLEQYTNPLTGILNLATNLPPESQNINLGPFIHILYCRLKDL
uniref:Lysine-specific demethylase JMJ25-like n=1 Tax=Tanacetum cinerariifolium TaxID=118510 RepID=A0A6L2K1L4_TANCI|nr:lysine-specific demethylase JMJ25-like [Tanacetum cinerariifolium]